MFDLCCEDDFSSLFVLAVHVKNKIPFSKMF
jgi:hypothetical protein